MARGPAGRGGAPGGFVGVRGLSRDPARDARIVRDPGAAEIRQCVRAGRCRGAHRRRPQDPALRPPAGTAARLLPSAPAGRHARAPHERRLRGERLRQRHGPGDRAAARDGRGSGRPDVPHPAGARSSGGGARSAVLSADEDLRPAHPAPGDAVAGGACDSHRHRRGEPRDAAGDQDLHAGTAGVCPLPAADRPHRSAECPAAQDLRGARARRSVRHRDGHRRGARVRERGARQGQPDAGAAGQLPAVRVPADAARVRARRRLWSDAGRTQRAHAAAAGDGRAIRAAGARRGQASAGEWARSNSAA